MIPTFSIFFSFLGSSTGFGAPSGIYMLLKAISKFLRSLPTSGVPAWRPAEAVYTFSKEK